jgi:hypothetical protein
MPPILFLMSDTGGGHRGRFAPAASAGFGFGYVGYNSIYYAIHHFGMKREFGFG